MYQKADYTKGVLNGRWERYYNNKLIEQGSYANGQKSGKWTFYDQNGDKIESRTF